MFLRNFRTANSLERFIRVKLFLKYQQFRLVDSSLREMSTKTGVWKTRKSGIRKRNRNPQSGTGTGIRNKLMIQVGKYD